MLDPEFVVTETVTCIFYITFCSWILIYEDRYFALNRSARRVSVSCILWCKDFELWSRPAIFPRAWTCSPHFLTLFRNSNKEIVLVLFLSGHFWFYGAVFFFIIVFSRYRGDCIRSTLANRPGFRPVSGFWFVIPDLQWLMLLGSV
jgi:hypothetical protein